jgi:large subunit ribosomal protein L18
VITKKDRNEMRQKRHQRIRNKINGTPECPRMNVFRSINHIYVQFIDDVNGVTLASASTLDADLKKKMEGKAKKEAAKMVGEAAAKKAIKKGVTKVVFDRGGYLYTGRVAQVAEGARAAGLKF